jgi:AraC family transcriptional regulator of adaptative response / DNA-3-methyladenine glycosylase II
MAARSEEAGSQLSNGPIKLPQFPARQDSPFLDPAICYQAIRSRDPRFDGKFFAAAPSTGLYCRSICPVPFARNLVLFSCAAAAEAAGFRPCRRCHAQASPGTPAWLGTSAAVSRALRLIWEGALDKKGVEELAGRVGIGPRHLRRLFVQHLGASPIQIAGTRRVHFARKLIDETNLPMTQISSLAGFMSIRQFNHAINKATGQTPSELRLCHDRSETSFPQKGLVIRLPYRPPLNWTAIIRFLRDRATPGVEIVTHDCYQRTIETEGIAGTLTVSPDLSAHRLIVCVELPDYRFLMQIVERIKQIFDLEADPFSIARGLARDPQMEALSETDPGLRVPGAWSGFELGVKAILGEQLMMRVSERLLRLLVVRFGVPIRTSVQGLTHLFPSPQVLAKVDLRLGLGISIEQARGIRALAVAINKGTLALDQPKTLEDTVSLLATIPGITPTTAHYIAMRGFGEPDAFPIELSALKRFIGTSSAPSHFVEKWRPWRAYAAIHIWARDGRPHKSRRLSG